MSVPRRVGAVVPSSVSSAWLRLAAGLPMPVVLMSMGGLSASKLSGTYTARHLLAGLNFLFLTLGSWFIAYLVGRSFLVRGQPGLLLLGCGMVVWGTGRWWRRR
ncbi:MAG TPA: hypothetical protein VNT26_09045 [Candidatus Sulfotelmatobacter sp.]|nr:hypothetical protein [Candidatus Sulfotelmatobacter sp.]